MRWLARRGVAALGAGDAAAAAGVRAWQGRARGAGGWCGAAFCVHHWYSVGERAWGSARACCAGWCYAAGAIRVGGPHGRGTLLRPCAPCNPARLMTQILGWGTLVDTAETLGRNPRVPAAEGRRGAGSSTVPYFPRNAVVAGRWCPVRSLMQSISFQSHYQTIFCSRSVHGFRIPPCGCRRARRSDTPGIGGGVFMATMVGGGASS